MHQAPYPYPATLIFGIPGAGKGTQGDILKTIPGFFHVSSGNIFRQMGDSTEEARTVREYLRAGETRSGSAARVGTTRPAWSCR